MIVGQDLLSSLLFLGAYKITVYKWRTRGGLPNLQTKQVVKPGYLNLKVEIRHVSDIHQRQAIVA